MGDKHKIPVILFLKIPSDEQFLLRFQVIWVFYLPVVFFRHQFLGLVKTHRRDFVNSRKAHIQHLKFLMVLSFQKFHGVLKKPCLHGHNVLKTVNIAHLKIQTYILI